MQSHLNISLQFRVFLEMVLYKRKMKCETDYL
jgi:hypothetical protein